MKSIISSLFAVMTISTALSPPNSLHTRETRDVKIQSVSMSGSGCPPNTALVQLLADGRTFTVIYDKFLAHAGRGTTDIDYQKLCELRVRFTHLSGYAFNVFNVTQHGFSKLQRRDTGVIDVNFGYSEEDQEVCSPILCLLRSCGCNHQGSSRGLD